MMEIFLDEVNKSIEGEFDIYFKFIEKIASGSFGTVMRAIYLDQNREVAVKIIDKAKHKFKNLNRLKLEINILKQLKHKNIVEFIGCIETNTKMYLITEYIRDGALKDFMENRAKADRKFSEEEISQIMLNLFDAVDYLHSREIVHRDIKPENILFDDYKDLSSLKLIDFGLSSQYFEMLGDFEFCGTLIYMAPEQIEKRVYTKAIDIWSCGIIMYMLLHNGLHPFHLKGENSSSFMDKLKQGKWECKTLISKMAYLLLQKLLEPNTSQRYSADKVLKHPWITRVPMDEIPKTYLETMRVFGSLMFLTQYKKQNENLFKKKTKETRTHLTESYNNLLENGYNPTKNKSSSIKEKISQNVLSSKENTKKPMSNLGDNKIKRNIKLNHIEYKRNNEDKFLDIHSNTEFFNYKRRVEKISEILQDNYFKEREFALEVVEPLEEIRIDTTSSKIRSSGLTIKLNLIGSPEVDLNNKINKKLNAMNDQSASIKNNNKLKVSKDFNSYVNKNIKQNSKSSNTSVLNRLYDSPIQMHARTKDNDKEKNEKEKFNNFKKTKFSITPILKMKKDYNSNNSEIGEFKLDLRKFSTDLSKLSPVKIIKSYNRDGIHTFNKAEIQESRITENETYRKKVNMIQVASSSILPNDVKFLSHNNQTDKNVNSSIKSIVLPRIHTPSYKNNSHNLRDSNHYGQQVNHHSEMQSNFNNQRVIQKNIRRK